MASLTFSIIPRNQQTQHSGLAVILLLCPTTGNSGWCDFYMSGQNLNKLAWMHGEAACIKRLDAELILGHGWF